MSQKMTDALDDIFGEGSDPAAQSPLPWFSPQVHWGVCWFCPACGVRINEDLECPRCGRHLRALAFCIQELHPHGPGRDPSQSDPDAQT
ncbi:MAG: hypothetical protein M3Q29_02385 [Chloroflexota bacterium]|nr:hypothetical protein [Chloroflexota bacterium]